MVHDAGKKKKADVKVIRTVNRITDDEIRKIIDNKIAAKETMIMIKVHLLEDKKIEEHKVNNIMLEFVKQKQQKLVDDLKKNS